jgi:enoyl-CoA hydratase/carnithine racemase
LGTGRSKVALLVVRVGLAGADMGACNMLPRIIGAGRAAELLYTGRAVDGSEAERWGFYNRLCKPDAVLPEAQALAKSLADEPTFAHAMNKRCIHQEWTMGIEERPSKRKRRRRPSVCKARTTNGPMRRLSEKRSPFSKATEAKRDAV